MKRKPYFYLLIIMMLVLLSACSGTSTEASTSTTTSEVTDGSDGTGDGTDAVTELIFGTLMLADTDYPVTADQASTMLPLWQLYQSMVSEDTTASEELDAIINQITKAFTEEQLAQMASFEYGNSMEMMTQMGINPNATSEDGTEVTVPDNFTMGDRGDMPEGGDFTWGSVPSGGSGGGAAPSGGGGDMAGGGGGMSAGSTDLSGIVGGVDDSTITGLDPESMTTDLTTQGTRTNSRQALMFLNTLINYLEEVVAS